MQALLSLNEYEQSRTYPIRFTFLPTFALSIAIKQCPCLFEESISSIDWYVYKISFHKEFVDNLSTPSSVWWRQIYLIYGTALTKVNRKLYTCKQPNGLKCPILQSDGWYKWAILRNKTDSEAMRDKQSNDTMLGGLSFLKWITGSDKGNNGMTKGWQDGRYQLLLKTPKRRQK